MANDKDLKDYLHRMIVPPGFRPQSDDEIKKALDAFDEGPLDDETVARILSKAKRESPLYYESEKFEVDPIEENAETDELLALHRVEGDVESDEVKEKLEKYRQQAKDQDDIEDESENDVD